MGDPGKSFITDIEESFWAGLARLNPNSIESIQANQQRNNLPPEYVNVITLPGWEAFVVHPEYLSPEEIAEMQRIMLGSPGEEYASSFGRILTAIDDTQDIIVTVGLIGHLAIALAPRALGFATPGVQAILVVSDLLNLMNLLGMTATPLYAAACGGVGAGIAAGIPFALMGPGLKGKGWNEALTSPFSRLGRLRAPLGKFGKAQAIALIIQAPQASGNVLGYGVALGAALGVITQSAFSLPIVLSGGSVGVKLPGAGEKIAGKVNRPLSQDPPMVNMALRRAASAMASVPSLLARPDVVRPGRYVWALAALYEAQRGVFKRLHGYPWREIALDALDQPARLASSPSWHHRELLAPLGLRDGQAVPWDGPDGALERAPVEQLEDLGRAVARGVERFCQAHRDTPYGPAAGRLAAALAEELWAQIADDDRAIAWQLAPDWAIASAHMENNRIPVVGVNDDRLWNYWQACRAEYERTPIARWTPATFDALAEKTGAKLLRGLPPDAPYPDEWVRWFNRHTQ